MFSFGKRIYREFDTSFLQTGIGYEKYTGCQGWRDSLNKKRDLIHDIVENLKSMDGMIEKLGKIKYKP